MRGGAEGDIHVVLRKTRPFRDEANSGQGDCVMVCQILISDVEYCFCTGDRYERRTGRRTVRAIGLVLLSIAIMALLLTDADAKRRSSAQGSQAAGASRSWCATHPRHGGENCGYTSFDQCWATIGAEGGFCRPNPFPGTAFGTGYNGSPGPSR